MRSMGNLLLATTAAGDGRDREVLPALQSTSLEEWAEANASRIWDLMRRAERRDVSFNDFAAELWRALP